MNNLLAMLSEEGGGRCRGHVQLVLAQNNAKFSLSFSYFAHSLKMLLQLLRLERVAGKQRDRDRAARQAY